MENLLKQIRTCRVCKEHLESGVNPVVAASPESKIIIIGQAPGRVVHNTGIPWDDKSGDNLRSWLEIDKATFYNEKIIALMPMGFCYPGKNKTGDLPPRLECAPLWHVKLLALMKDARLILLIGQYAQRYYLRDQAESTLTETVRNFRSYLPTYLPLPHPSPRNFIWQAKNSWFGNEVLPELKRRIHEII